MRIGIPEKLALTLFMIVAAVVLPWTVSMALALALVVARMVVPALRPMDSQAAGRFRKVLSILLLLAIVMTFLNGVFMATGRTVLDLGLVRLSEGGIQFGLATGCRLLLIATAFLVLFGSTTIAAFAEYLNRIGLPSPIVTTLLLALHFLDHLPEKIQQIFIAQESRGASVRGSLLARTRSFFLLLTPLVLSSIVESIDRGTALELRGFHSGASLRSAISAEEYRTWSAVTIVFLALSGLLVIYRVLSWLIPSQ